MLNVECPKLSIHLGMEVTQINYHDIGEVRVKGVKKAGSTKDEDGNPTIFKCRAVILAAPPRVLANTIDFQPPLLKRKIGSMLATPTRMEDYGKVAISFPIDWRRQRNMSGISIDHKGAVATWREACSGSDGDGALPTLAGFVTSQGAGILNKAIRYDGPRGLYTTHAVGVWH